MSMSVSQEKLLEQNVTHIFPHLKLSDTELVHTNGAGTRFRPQTLQIRWFHFIIRGVVIHGGERLLRRFDGVRKRDWKAFEVAPLNIGYSVGNMIALHGSSVDVFLGVQELFPKTYKPFQDLPLEIRRYENLE